MNNDRQIIISAAGSRRATNWPQQTLWWSEFVEKLKTPVRGVETIREYLGFSKGKQDDLKDVGGFVGGIINGQRKADNVTGRDLLTLDLDNIPAGETEEVIRRIEGLGCGYAVYSTRKHEESKPRLRVIVPLSRTVSADEYEPIARKLAGIIGIDLCDATTFQASRLMYWPSCCSDSKYICTCGDKPMLDADGILAMYMDWHNVAEWPQVPGAQVSTQRLIARQGDPTAKNGVVGAFCKTYDIYRAIEEIIPGDYEPCDIEGRYTFTGGSTTGGAIIYDDGSFLYSHHATDPAGGRLCNSFDLVRLHKFSELDAEAKTDTPTNKLPSYSAMKEFAVAIPQVGSLIGKERYEKAVADFSASPDETSLNWIEKLQVNSDGRPIKTIDNIWLILENDRLLKGKFALNEFANRGEILGAVPWNEKSKRRFWGDNDNHGLSWYLEKAYQIIGDNKVAAGLSLHSAKHSFNEIKNYLSGLSWDGVNRLDTMLIDYLGAADNEYTRAVTRKAFTAAVARAMTPGIKFDCMTVISGPQGIGKSTLLYKMAKGWYTDSLRTFEGKEASELIQGIWIIEVSEMDAFRSSDINRVKQFLSQQIDRFRAAYGRNVQDCPRCCVFFGTSNNCEYLRDKTGNRRFWPVDAGIVTPTKSVFSDLDNEIDQIWAEAFVCWQLGEPLYLSGEADKIAKGEQENHREYSEKEGLIREFVDRKVPKGWEQWDLSRRQMFWAGQDRGQIELVDRQQVCALEVWQELFGGDTKALKRWDSIEINETISSIEGWSKIKTPRKYAFYGSQRCFRRM